MELSGHSVAGKRPAPEKSDRLEGICYGWGRMVPTRSKKPYLEKVPYARGVCKKLSIFSHSEWLVNPVTPVMHALITTAYGQMTVTVEECDVAK